MPESLRKHRISLAAVIAVHDALISFADRDGENAYPKRYTLQTMTGLSESSVRNALRVLRQDNIIEKTGEKMATSKQLGRPCFIPVYAFPGVREWMGTDLPPLYTTDVEEDSHPHIPTPIKDILKRCIEKKEETDSSSLHTTSNMDIYGGGNPVRPTLENPSPGFINVYSDEHLDYARAILSGTYKVST